MGLNSVGKTVHLAIISIIEGIFLHHVAQNPKRMFVYITQT